MAEVVGAVMAVEAIKPCASGRTRRVILIYRNLDF
jgi:hypothetical protein